MDSKDNIRPLTGQENGNKDIGVEIRNFGRNLMFDKQVRGVKLAVFLKDGRYVEYNNTFDPLFDNKRKED